jgi:hypothetical protein
MELTIQMYKTKWMNTNNKTGDRTAWTAKKQKLNHVMVMIRNIW